MVEPVKEPVKVSLSDILCHLSNQGNFMFFSKVVSSLQSYEPRAYQSSE